MTSGKALGIDRRREVKGIAQHVVRRRDGAAPLDRDPADDDVAAVAENPYVLAIVHPKAARIEPQHSLARPS